MQTRGTAVITFKTALLLGAALTLLPGAGEAQTRPTQQAVAAAARPTPNAWAHEASDLQPDPAARFGVLPNGMRYMIYRNATPPGEVSLRLRFAVGKLHGPDEQHGLAHFIEHMAFNGSTNVPEGEMTKRLERAGLRFGGDTNALTSPTQTVYLLDVPGATPEKLDTAFLFMRELASELSFTPEALERERGVIQSEERTQYVPARLSLIERFGFLLKDQLGGRRSATFGDPKTIASADRNTFLDIYRRYYRPERATFIVVGDVDPDQMEAEIRRRFSNWRPVGPAGAEPDLGRVAARSPEAKAAVGEGLPAGVSLYWMRPYQDRPDTRAERIRKARERLALAVLNSRFARMVESGSAPFTQAGAASAELFQSADMTEVGSTPVAGRETEALRVLEQEVRRGARYGVLQAELDREIVRIRGQLQSQAAGAATRRTPMLATQFAFAVDSRDVILSPAQELAVFEEAVRGLTANQVNATLKPLLDGGGPLVFATGPKPIAGGEAALLAALNQSRQGAVAPPAAVQAKAWPYARFGAPGQVAERSEIADLGVTRVRFANGVHLLVKPTSFRKDQVLVSARVAGGRAALPPSLVTWPASQRGFVAGGLKQLSEEERREALAGKVYDVRFNVTDDAFLFGGATRPEDLPTQMQVLAAHVAEPGWRPEAFDRVKALLGETLVELDASPLTAGLLRSPRLVRGGDARWGVPNRQELAGVRLPALRAAIDPVLSRGPLEVVVVGDVTVDQAIAQTAATFGALPARQAATPRTAAERLQLTATGGAPMRVEHAGRPDAGMAVLSWRTDDFFDDVRQARVVELLRAVVHLRVTAKLREELGATYTPFVQSEASEVFDEVGLLTIAAEVKPQEIARTLAAMEEMGAELARGGVTADELDRARAPLLATLAKDQAGNEWWASQLAGVSWDPRRLDKARTERAHLEAITLADVNRAAAAYLTPNRSWKLVVEPRATAPAGGR
jgi:zinc protease